MVKYGYVVFPTNKGNGYLTVAISRPEKGDTTGKHVAAFAFCSLEDTFTKKNGRMKAEAKLISKSRIEFICNGDWNDVLNTALVEYMFKFDVVDLNDKIPDWLRKGIRKKNYKIGLRPSVFEITANEQIKQLSNKDLFSLIRIAKKEYSTR